MAHTRAAEHARASDASACFRYRAKEIEVFKRHSRSRVPLADLLSEALAGIGSRPGRAVMTSLGTVAGVAALVATFGLTATAEMEVRQRFDALASTEVILVDSEPEKPDPPFPSDTESRLLRVQGVEAAGSLWQLNQDGVQAYVRPFDNSEITAPINVMAASAGAIEVVRPSLTAGTTFNAFHESRGDRVGLLGAAVARNLGISDVDGYASVFIEGVPFLVIGIIGDVERHGDLLASVIIPSTTADVIWGRPNLQVRSVIIATLPGTSDAVGRLAPLALRPHDTERLQSQTPPDPKSLRQQVESEVNALLLLLGGVSLLIGAMSIANTTMVSVLERKGEIGLKRAVGASRRHVATQFVIESAALGTIGGIAGTWLGVMTVAAVSLIRDWAPVMEPVVVTASPFVGTLAGILAGLYPAWRAASIQPVAALK